MYPRRNPEAHNHTGRCSNCGAIVAWIEVRYGRYAPPLDPPRGGCGHFARHDCAQHPSRRAHLRRERPVFIRKPCPDHEVRSHAWVGFAAYLRSDTTRMVAEETLTCGCRDAIIRLRAGWAVRD